MVIGNGNGIRWGLLVGLMTLAGGCARPIPTTVRVPATAESEDRATLLSGPDPCVGWRTGSSLVPVRLVERRSDGFLVLEGLWPFSPPPQQLPPNVTLPTQLPLYALRCTARMEVDGSELSVDTVNVLTAPAIGPTLTVVFATSAAGQTATSDVLATATAHSASTPPPTFANAPSAPIHIPLDSVEMLCGATPSGPLVDVGWDGTAWILSFDELRSPPVAALIGTPGTHGPSAVADRCTVTLHPSGEHEVSHQRLATSAATPVSLDGRTPAPDLCAGYNKHLSLIPVHLTEIYLDTTQTGTWNLVLDGLWPLFGAPAPPAHWTPIATEAPSYQSRCHLHLYPDGHEGNGGDVINVLTAPAIGPTLTIAIATRAAERTALSATWSADKIP